MTINICFHGISLRGFTSLPSDTRMAQLLGRIWDRARGNIDVHRICDQVFEKLADRNVRLLGVNSLHVATLMVYNKINKKMPGPHKNPPCMEVVTVKMECYRAEKIDMISREEFRKLIMEWINKDLRHVLVSNAAVAMVAGPVIIVRTREEVEKVPRIKNALAKVPTPLLCAVISVGVLVLQGIRDGMS